MGKSLLAFTNTNRVTAPTGTILPFGQSGTQVSGTTENTKQAVAGVAGAICPPATLKVNATGGGRTVGTRISTANGNILISPTDSTSGIYQDTTHYDQLTAGQVYNLTVASTAGSPIYYFVSAAFQGSTTHATLYQTWQSSAAISSATTTFYMAPSGGFTNIPSAEANVQFLVRQGGTARYLYQYISATTASSTVVRFRKNGVNGNQVVAPNGVTGLFVDTTNSDAVASGDLINFSFVKTTDGTITSGNAGVTIVTTDGLCKNDVIFSGNPATISTSSTIFCAITGAESTIYASSTEGDAQIRHGFPVTVSRLRFYINTNATTAGSSAKSRLNGANGSMSITIGSAATGYVEDTTNSDSVGPTDNYCWSFAPGSANNVSFQVGGVTEQESVLPLQPVSADVTGNNPVKVVGY